jgi:hypothetical protein
MQTGSYLTRNEVQYSYFLNTLLKLQVWEQQGDFFCTLWMLAVVRKFGRYMLASYSGSNRRREKGWCWCPILGPVGALERQFDQKTAPSETTECIKLYCHLLASNVRNNT